MIQLAKTISGEDIIEADIEIVCNNKKLVVTPISRLTEDRWPVDLKKFFGMSQLSIPDSAVGQLSSLLFISLVRYWDML